MWRDLDPARVLFEDADLIAIDKPEGVPSQAADQSAKDDLVTRLERFIAARDGVAEPYVGVHQRLDKDTSGVILYTKQKRANPGLAKQMEGREVQKSYLAIVCGWRGGDRKLEHRLAPGRDGRMEIAAPRDRKAKPATTHVRLRERHGERALVELSIETGRTHQIRAQLAAEGAPVAGDAIYGGEPAPRLMLHAARIALRHPTSNTAISIESPMPAALARHLAHGSSAPFAEDALRDSLARAIERRWGLGQREGCLRLVNEDGDGLPGLAVDLYGEWLVAHDYGLEEEVLASALDALGGLGMRGVYLKRRPKQANEIVDARSEAYSPSAPVRGQPAPEILVVREGGLDFEVRLAEGLSTGLFLDQRDNRRRVRERSDGARALNLFAYTCGFGVAAAMGGASTVNVDASARALGYGRRNYACNGLDEGAHRFVHADVFETLDAMIARKERFDRIFVDPPTYSRTKASRWTSGRDWARLCALALRLLAKDGAVLACSNDRRMTRSAFRRVLHEAGRSAAIDRLRIRDLPCPSDFPAPVGREPHLKSAWIERA